MAGYLALILILVICLFFTNCALLDPVGFSIPIIHRNSPSSPFYDPSFTILDLAKSDQIRLEYLKYQQEGFNFRGNFRGPISATAGLFLMEIYVGSSFDKRYVDIDTGSDIIWLQCVGLTDKYRPPLDLSRSKTYRSVPCNYKFCKDENRMGCDFRTNRCMFGVTYADQTRVEGRVVADFFVTLVTSGVEYHRAEYHTIGEVIFGCANYLNQIGEREKNADGMLGLGLGNVSLISQLSVDRFSYCLPPPPASREMDGDQYIRFESFAILEGKIAPFIPFFNRYALTLKGISVGLTRLPVEIQGNDSRMLIDTGMTRTVLNFGAYAHFSNALPNAISLVEVKSSVFRHCYLGTLKDVAGINFTLHFFGGVDIVLSKWSAFLEISTEKFGPVVCCLVEPFGISILGGGLAQTNYNVGYDLLKGEVSFQPTSC